MAVTSGKAWRKRREEGVEVQFPTTGNVARIRPLDMEFFIKQGRIQNLLESAVFEQLAQKEVTAFSETEVTAFQSTVEFLNSIVTHCFVSPKIVENPVEDDEISIADVVLEDKYFLFTLLVRPAQTLDHFRPKQGVDVGSMATPEVNGAASESNHEHRGVGESDDGNAGLVDGSSV